MTDIHSWSDSIIICSLEFLKHASCYRNISMDVDKCATKYRDAVKASSNATETQNPEKSIKLSCWWVINVIRQANNTFRQLTQDIHTVQVRLRGTGLRC